MRVLRVLQRQPERIRARMQEAAAPLVAASPEEAALMAYGLFERESERARQSSLGPGPACAAGCSFCCHVNVDVTYPELTAIARFLRRTRSPAEVTRLRQLLAERLRLDDEGRWAAKVPCALLDEQGRCSIYEVRPLPCRAFHSCSMAACQAAHAGGAPEIPDNPTLTRAHDAALAGYYDALEISEAGAETTLLEIGLLAALDAT